MIAMLQRRQIMLRSMNAAWCIAAPRRRIPV
jgi:hypothetical protein